MDESMVARTAITDDAESTARPTSHDQGRWAEHIALVFRAGGWVWGQGALYVKINGKLEFPKGELTIIRNALNMFEF